MFEKLTTAEPVELQAWMIGAGMTGFGLGALLAPHVRRYAPWLIAAGLVLHGWGMYKIYVQA